MKKLNNKGQAIIAVLCVMGIMVVLCLSMLLASSVLSTRANAKQYEEQCRVSAVTMTKELDISLINDTDSSIYKYVQNNIQNGTWPYLNTDELGHGVNSGVYRDFVLEDSYSNTTGEISLRMYWESEFGGDPKDYILTLELTAEKNKSKYTIISSYELSPNEDGWSWELSERRG